MTQVYSNSSATGSANNFVTYDSNDYHEQEPTTINGSQDLPPSSARSGKRCEAFVMTGDKILNLNPKISPLYAAIRSGQLPPKTEVDEDVKYVPQVLPDVRRQTSFSGEFFETPVRYTARNGTSNQSTSNSKNGSTCTLPEYNTEDQYSKTPSFINPSLFSISKSSNRTAVEETYSFKSSSTVPTSGKASVNNIQRINNILDPFVQKMFDLQGFTRSSVTDNLMRIGPDREEIVSKFFALFNFAGLRIDVALRYFLEHVCLKGETTQRESLLQSFADRYFECNLTVFENADQIHALTCALILLNTDLHGDNVGKKMTVREFVENLGHTGHKYERNLLKLLYNAIKSEPFVNLDNVETYRSEDPRITRRISEKPSQIEIKDQIDYKHGWLLKKTVYDIDGKSAPFGRRGWVMYYATIRGMVLYLHKNEHGFEANKFSIYKNCISLHHSVASFAKDYKKRQNVFRLRTANYGEFLMQTSNATEVSKWMDAINYVAAAFSAPAMPFPVSADEAWVHLRPTLPFTPSNLSIPDQLKSHLSKIDETKEALNILQKNAPSIHSKGKLIQEYFKMERRFLDERERYTVYANVLRDKLNLASTTSFCSRNNSTRALGHPKMCTLTTNSAASPSVEFIRSGSFRGPEPTAALAEALAIANGCITADDDRLSYKEAFHY